MPELPEVETVRRGLQAQVVGRRITQVEVGRERTVRRTSRRAVIDGLTGATITAVNRRGKYLLCPLDTGDEVMMHLRMSGRLLVAAAGTERPPHTHVVMHLAGRPAQELWFVDPRTFGEVVVFDPANLAVELPELARLGVDPIADGLTRVSLDHRMPVAFGVLTTDTPKQARDRAGGKHGNKGAEAMAAALDTLSVLRDITAASRGTSLSRRPDKASPRS